MSVEKKWEVVFAIMDIMESKAGQLFTCTQILQTLVAQGFENISIQKVERNLRDLCSSGRVESNGQEKRNLAYKAPRKNQVRFFGNVKPNDLFSFLLWSRVQGELFRDPSGFDPFRQILSQQMKVDTAIHGKDIYSDFDAKLSSLVFFAGQQTVVGPKPNVAPILLEALVKSCKVKVLYESQKDSAPKWRTLEPWCLLVYRQEMYFLCPGEKSKDTLLRYKLARVHEAKLLRNEVFTRDSALLRKEQEHLQKVGGMWDNRDSAPQKVRLAFSWNMRHYMNEVHFCQSQKVILHEESNPEESWTEVTMTVPIGEDLLDWVRRWGDACEVLGPKALKDTMYEYGEWLTETYGG